MHPLIGTWQFQRSEIFDQDKNSLANDPYNNAAGVLIYTTEKYMSAQLCLPNDSVNESNITIQTNYIAYYGKVTVDNAKQHVSHQVISSNISNMINKIVTRQFEFNEDNTMLVLMNTEAEAYGTDEKIFRKLFWKRLEA